CYAYVACQSGGFQVIKISDYVSPSLTGTFDISSNVRDVAIAGDIAYLADYANGMTVIDISDPSTPFHINSYATPDNAQGIVVDGNFAYVADMLGGLTVFNITDPYSAFSVDRYDTSSYTYAVDIAGDYAYLASYANGLRVLDISDPSNLVFLGSIGTPDSVQDIDVVGNYAYLAARTSGLVIYNITNPSTPSYVGGYITGSTARGVTVVNNLAFVGASGSGMEIIDISNPSSPSFIGSCDTSNNAWAVDVVGDLAFIADYEGGLSIANITDPTDPYIIYSYDTSDQAFSVSVYGDYAYVGDSNGGLLIFECYLNKAEQYASPTISQSTEIYSESTTAIISANLLSKGSIPSDTSLSYYLSSNGGTNWEQVSNDTEHLFTNTGNQLKWRIILETQNISITPSVKALSILYSTKLLSPYLLSPIDGYITDDYTPTFTWSGIDGETNYLFQLDTTTSFTDPPLNFTLPSSITSYTPISPLASDTYYWRVAGIDSEGDIGEFSSYNTLYIIQDTVAPSINHPNDIICELGTIGNNIIWSPMDSNPYWYNITLNSILTSHDDPWTGGSIIMDIDGLPLGTYTVVCSVYDLEGFMTSDTVNIEVVSTAPPTIDDVADFPYEEDSTGNSITWHPSDTNPDYYSVTRDGTVIDDGSWVGGDINIDIDGLAYGVYTFVCTVNDTEGQEASDTAIVSVTDSVNPILNSPSDIIYSEGDTGNNIIWVATDNNPETYIVYKDGTLYEGDTWVSGSSIIVSVDGLTSGSQYNFTIVIVDQVGNAAKDTVIVAVTAAVPEYQMFSVLLATCVILSLASIHARRKKRKDS
ncbi:MAG: hypothetical protein KAR08_00480, partial [Candidatus Heimdallarchaeota archaeon]|nr:hypothetical protein [Candidatus Heimdallarchaeota archaeon]